jgi:hypothetical protein
MGIDMLVVCSHRTVPTFAGSVLLFGLQAWPGLKCAVWKLYKLRSNHCSTLLVNNTRNVALAWLVLDQPVM